MAYNPPNIQQIIDRIKTYLKEVLKDLNPTDQNNFIYSLVVAMANLSNDNNIQIKVDILPNSFVNTVKTEEELKKFAKIKNISKNQSTISAGKAVISGIEGKVVPLGAIFIANNVRYKTESSVEIAKQAIKIKKISANGNRVTVQTTSAHNFASNILVDISECLTAEFNGNFPINVTGADTFEYNVPRTVVATEDGVGNVTAVIGVLNFSSVTAGANTNLKNGDALAIETAIAGVNNNAYTMFSGISGGTDIESFADWKSRVEFRYQNPITYFNEANIITAVKKIAGNTRVWVLQRTPMTGQVTIYFVRDNDEDIIPDTNEITEAKNAIVALRTVKDDPADIFVYAPTPKRVNFVFSSITPNTPTMKNAIRNSLKQLFDEEVDLSKSISLDKIKSAIQNSFDLETGKKLDTYTLTEPTTDIEIATGELATLNDITFL